MKIPLLNYIANRQMINNSIILKYLCIMIVLFSFPKPCFTQNTKSFSPVIPPAPINERRLALVIGNKDYSAAHASLINPINDAEDMTKILRQLGFVVLTYQNVSKKDFMQAIDEFGDKLKNYDVGLFYYSGHGGQSRGESFLIPSDINLNSSLEYDCVNLGRVFQKMEEASSKINIAFIDACRTNPLEKKRAIAGEGLAQPNNPSGSMVVYATRAGQPARDDNPNGRNGLFTGELIKQLRNNPTLGLREILDKTSSGVETLSEKKQKPGRYDELSGDFYFLKGNKIITSPTSESYDDVNSTILQGDNAFNQKQYDDAFRLLYSYREHALFKPQNLNQLGYMYDMGYGVKQDYSEAVKWYQKAAQQGNVLGQYNLAIMYEKGFGITQDYKMAAEWYKKAAIQNFVDAQYNLGLLYEKGMGISQNYQEALIWYLKAADQGDIEAQVNLGCLYENGNGVPKDINEAIRWYRRAAELGDSDGQYNLARLNINLTDSQEEFNLYTKAATQGHIYAQVNLGYLYENGRGVAKNYELANSWYQKAANEGNPVGQFNLGVMFESKRNAIINYREALNWYEKSAKQEYPLAQYNLAILYENGKGTPKDMKVANDLYKKAAKQNILGAQKALGRFGLTW